jgi:hypothetical protein
MNDDLVMRGIKLIDIGWVSCGYLIMALVASILFKKFLPKTNPEKVNKKSTAALFGDLLFKAWLVGVLAYFARNIMPLVPFPLDGFKGFSHLRVKEVSDGFLFVPFLLTFTNLFADPANALYDRVVK